MKQGPATMACAFFPVIFLFCINFKKLFYQKKKDSLWLKWVKRKRAQQPLCGAKQEPGEGGVDVFRGVQPVGLVRGHLYPDLVVLLEFKHGAA